MGHDEVPNKVGAIVRTQSGTVLSEGDIIQMVKVKKSMESARPKERTLTRREEIPNTWEELDDCQADAGVVHDNAEDTVAHLKVGSIAGEIVEVPTAEMTTIGDVKNFLKSDAVVKLFRH